MAKQTNLDLVEFARDKTYDKQAKIQWDKHRIMGEAYTNYNANLNDDLVIIFLGFVKAEKGYKYSYSNFPFYRLVYTIAGQATLITQDKQHEMTNGTICGFEPNNTDTICVNSNATWEHYYLHFTGKNAGELFRQTKLNTRRIIRTSDPPRMHHYFEDMMDSERSKLELAHVINVHILGTLLSKLVNDACIHTEDNSMASRESYLMCREYINANFSKIRSLEDISENCNLSKPHICYLFNQHAKISPMAYVTKLKMNKAAILLLQTYLSIKQISRVLSFDDQYYFSRLFRKYYGISPKYYRNSQSK